MPSAEERAPNIVNLTISWNKITPDQTFKKYDVCLLAKAELFGHGVFREAPSSILTE